jgi:hypothetical protein
MKQARFLASSSKKETLMFWASLEKSIGQDDLNMETFFFMPCTWIGNSTVSVPCNMPRSCIIRLHTALASPARLHQDVLAPAPREHHQPQEQEQGEDPGT